jgi:shikimate dehydrogenase
LGAAGAADIAIRDVDLAKASALVERLKAAGYPARLWDGGPGSMQLVINATPIGMKPTDALPFAAEVVHAGLTVADVIMEPRTTRLLALAQDKGAKIVHGQHMMDEQLDAMVAFFAPAIRAVQGSR